MKYIEVWFLKLIIEVQFMRSKQVYINCDMLCPLPVTEMAHSVDGY